MTTISDMLVTCLRARTMDERDKRRVGEEIEPGGRPKAPGSLELLQRFVNTRNHELPANWDRLGTADKAEAWLRSKELMSARDRITPEGAARLRELRELLRGLAVAHHRGVPPPAAAGLPRGTFPSAGLRVELDGGGRARLEPTGQGVDGAVAKLLSVLHEAQLLGTWPRLKGCRQCGYAFYDRSKNRSAAWCAMTICGNRTKNRTYRRRRWGVEGARDPGLGRRS
jgi:predicted RNA-binding Zn ribbon-like protein